MNPGTAPLTVQTIPLTNLHPYHRNPRRGNVPAITESLQTLGQYRPIVVNTGTHTGRPQEILAGNHTFLAARELDWDTIDAVTIDVDDHTAARIVAVDNRTTDLATNDDTILAALLSDLPDLAGTGYTDDDLQALLDNQLPAEGDAPTDDSPPLWGVIVTCQDEQQQTDLLERLAAEGHDVRALLA